ncbi:hypothetical protein [Natrialba asiatica]|uniref:Uncharacterized protein n=1 Tax=Natrialba asiatica (strain ATCC 700177 / DSM 12278 / JCM 9576 / FERM P-10747 / NBRC 102637 / 172P1) TaxID=29540 RepID=M0B274_NATA1|nr:hypothetical protein [Natrialba asiatica]ELZ04885.1 hypothetical protein C481_03862 [Natrialba asiatica DSM 12278]
MEIRAAGRERRLAGVAGIGAPAPGPLAARIANREKRIVEVDEPVDGKRPTASVSNASDELAVDEPALVVGRRSARRERVAGTDRPFPVEFAAAGLVATAGDRGRQSGGGRRE